MGGSQANARGDGMLTEINVTPLVDVVLVLLVVLMVAATAIANRSISVEVPKARTGDADGKKSPLVLVVDEGGAIFVGAERLDDAAVRERARGVRELDASAVIAADGRARHEAVVHALDLLRAERIGKVAIMVRGVGPQASDARTP